MDHTFQHVTGITPEQLRLYQAFVRIVGVELANKILPEVGRFMRSAGKVSRDPSSKRRDI